MKLREKIKRFCRLDVHNHEGFTLVELIIVIAILAILSSVAVVGYSSYIKKANIQADQTLFEEIKNAVVLAYYSNADEDYSGYISLSATGGKASSKDLEKALADAFGENWSSALKIKYAGGWTSSSYLSSSFASAETALLGRVDDLTDVLQDMLLDNADLTGPQFESYLGIIGVDPDDTAAVADAAVLYVASTSTGNIDRENAIYYMSNLWINNGLNNAAMTENGLTACFGSDLAAAAAVYAMFEGYCRYEAKQNHPAPLAKLDKSEFVLADDESAMTTVLQVIYGIINDKTTMDGCDPSKYFGTEKQAETDAVAYLDLMQTVNSAEKQITSLDAALGSADFFSNATLTELFGLVAEGGALILVDEKDGQLEIELPTLN